MSTAREKMLCAIGSVLTDQPRLTMEQIAQAIGTSRATLHRMFPSREAVVAELSVLARQRACASVESVGPEVGPADAVIARLIASFLPNADLYLFLSRTEHRGGRPQPDDEWAPYEQRILEVFRRGQEEGVFRIDMSARWMLDAMGALLFAAADSIRAGRLASAEAGAAVSGMLLDGIRRRPTQR